MVINRYYPFIGGNETQCKLLSEELASIGVKVSVVTTWILGERLYENINDVRVFRILPRVRTKFLLWPTALLANIVLFLFLLANRKKYDVIHAHQALWHALGVVIAGKILKKKSIVKVAGGGPYGNMDFWRNKRHLGLMAINLLKKADVIVSLSDEIVKELSSLGIQDNLVTISNGVRISDIPKYESDDKIRTLRSRYNKIALFVGRLVEEKGVDILLKAWIEVRKEEPQAGLIIVGNGPGKKRLSQFVKKNEMTGCVIFTGEENDIVRYLNVSDIFILPSRGGEGMSNALLEAMSNGLPCIVSGIGGNLKLIKHQETGMIFRNEESQSLMQHIIQLFQNRQLALELGNNARDYVRNHFSIGIIACRYLQLYSQLLTKSEGI